MACPEFPFDRCRRGLQFALLVVAAMSLGACVKRGGNVPYAPSNFGPPDKSQADEASYDLTLGPLDILKIKVFRIPELSGDYQVDAKGGLDMPLIGSVSVRDKYPQDFAKELEQLYSAQYLNNPQISVQVISTNNNSITLEGGLSVPGVYQLNARTTLLGAVALAHGIAQQDANPRRVVVFRKRDGKTMAAAFDLIAIRRGEMEDPTVYPGDVIVVDTSQIRPIYRDLIQSLPIVSIFLAL